MIDLTPDINRKITDATDLIRLSDSIVVLSGAGSSTPSGIPDFRSPNNGLWNRFSPMEVASLTSFRYHPEKFYEWLRPFILNLIEAKPNPFHFAIKSLEKSGNLKAVITQNIDGLHQKAGSKIVIEVHGCIDSIICIGCYKTFPSKNFIQSFLNSSEIPTCPECRCILKPNVVLFEEQLPVEPWLKAKKIIEGCDLLIVAGSSLTVTPVANLPLDALENNARIIIVNQSPTYIDNYCEIVIQGDVAEIMPSITSKVLDTSNSIA